VSTKEADWRRVGAVMVQELMMGSELGYEEAMSNCPRRSRGVQAPFAFPYCRSVFVWGFCMGAQGA
jgi:hypothetical protein